MKRLLVCGVGGAAAVNFVRALRESAEKFFVVGTDCSKYHIHLNRGIDKRFLVPKYSDINYIQRLNQIIESEQIQFLHAQPDVEVGRISEDREKLRAKVLLPSKETVSLCHDKYELIKLLRKQALPTARNIRIDKEGDIETAFKKFGKKIWLRATKGSGGAGSLPVEKFDHAKAWIEYWKGWKAFVAEEYLPGRNMAWQGIFKEGELITSLVWQRIEYIISHVSPSGITGTPSVAKIIVEEKVNRTAMEAVSSISEKPNGVFSIDFKESKDGIPCVTEVNPGRFFTPSYMYVKAGVNLPEIYLKLAFDEAIPKLPQFNAFKRKIVWIRGIDVEPVATDAHLDCKSGRF